MAGEEFRVGVYIGLGGEVRCFLFTACGRLRC